MGEYATRTCNICGVYMIGAITAELCTACTAILKEPTHV